MNVYILYIGGQNTGKAVVLRTNNHPNSKAFKEEANRLCSEYGSVGFVTREKTDDSLKTRWVGPCEILNA